MNKTVISLDFTTHQAVQQLLPWLPGGTLDPAEQAMVQHHLSACAQCQADLALQCAWSASQPPVSTAFDADRAFAKLLPRLWLARQPVPLTQWLKRLLGEIRTWQWAAASQLLVIAVLANVLARPGSGDAPYRGLGAAAGPQGAVVVVFKPDTPEREIRRIVRASRARLVDGPTAADAFVLDVPAGSLKASLASLRAEPAVAFAQPLVADMPP